MAKHYIITDLSRRVLRGFSDDFEQPESNAICICEDGGRHFELNGVINPSLEDENRIPLYKLVNGIIVERSETERTDEIALIVPVPTIEERTAALESAVLEIILRGEL